MGTNCAPLVADLFLFCYERDFVLSLSEDNQSDGIEAFYSTSRYLDDLLNIDNNFFASMVNRIYSSELQLNKANVSDTETLFLWTYIYLYLMVLSRLKFMINEKAFSKFYRRHFDIVSKYNVELKTLLLQGL